MMASSVPQAVQSCHELLLWLIPQLDKFPRVRRFTLGERIEAGLLAVLELVVEAAYTRNKEAPPLPCRNADGPGRKRALTLGETRIFPTVIPAVHSGCSRSQ